MNNTKRLERIEKEIRRLIKWPPKSYSRRTEDGYPQEIVYDEFAYKRIIDSYRRGLKYILRKDKP